MNELKYLNVDNINFDSFNDEANKSYFIKNGFGIIKNAISNNLCQELTEKIEFKNTNKKSQFYRRHSKDNTFASIIMGLLKDPLSNFTSKLLYPSYSFGIEYLKKTNDTMTGHYDTFANPISLTLCIYNSHPKKNSALYIDPSTFHNPYVNRVTILNGFKKIKNKIALNLSAGDIGIFRGREHLHWREACEADSFKGILLHYFDYSTKNGNPPTQKYIRELPFLLFKGKKVFKDYIDFKEKMSLFFY